MNKRTTNPISAAAVDSTKAEKLPTQPEAASGCCEHGEMGEPHDCQKMPPKPSRFAPFRFAFQRWWIARVSWPLSKSIGMLLCLVGRHAWEDSSVIDAKGEPVTDKPGLYKRCARPACRIYRDRPLLKLICDSEGNPRWIEVSDDFEVIARASCPACQGRGSARSMLLPSAPEHKVTALIPCQCLRIQPRFIRRAPAKGGAK